MSADTLAVLSGEIHAVGPQGVQIKQTFPVEHWEDATVVRVHGSTIPFEDVFSTPEEAIQNLKVAKMMRGEPYE